jgi:hypothetical protein
LTQWNWQKVARGFCGSAVIGLAAAYAASAGAQAAKYPSWLFDRSQLQAQNCGYDQGLKIEDLIRYGTPPGSAISCYYKHAMDPSPDIFFELRIPASGGDLELAVSTLLIRSRTNASVTKRHVAFGTLACSDAPLLGRFLLERMVYDGDRYLPMPKVTACRVDQASYAAAPPHLTPFGYKFGSGPNARPEQRRTILFTVSRAELTKGLPAHLKRPKK